MKMNPFLLTQDHIINCELVSPHNMQSSGYPVSLKPTRTVSRGGFSFSPGCQSMGSAEMQGEEEAKNASVLSLLPHLGLFGEVRGYPECSAPDVISSSFKVQLNHTTAHGLFLR